MLLLSSLLLITFLLFLSSPLVEGSPAVEGIAADVGVMFLLPGDPSVSPMFLLLLGYMMFLLLFTVYCCDGSLVVDVVGTAENIRVVAGDD
jgi:hypothetical protein